MRKRTMLKKVVLYALVILVIISTPSVISGAVEGSNDASDEWVVFSYRVVANESRYINTGGLSYSLYFVIDVLTKELGAQSYVIVRFIVNSTLCLLYSEMINVTIVMNRSDYFSYLSGGVASLELNFSLGKGLLACMSSDVTFVESLFGDLATNLSIVRVTSGTGRSYDFVIGEFSGVSGSLGSFLVRGGVYVNRSSFFIFLPYMSKAWGRGGPYLAGYSFFIGSERTRADGLRFAVPVVINSSWPADWLGSIYVEGLGSLGLGRLIAGKSTIMGEYHLITASPDLVDMVYKQLYERGDDFVEKDVLANGTVRMVYDPLGLFINETSIDSSEFGKICRGGESGGVI